MGRSFSEMKTGCVGTSLTCSCFTLKPTGLRGSAANVWCRIPRGESERNNSATAASYCIILQVKRVVSPDRLSLFSDWMPPSYPPREVWPNKEWISFLLGEEMMIYYFIKLHAFGFNNMITSPAGCWIVLNFLSQSKADSLHQQIKVLLELCVFKGTNVHVCAVTEEHREGRKKKKVWQQLLLWK